MVPLYERSSKRSLKKTKNKSKPLPSATTTWSDSMHGRGASSSPVKNGPALLVLRELKTRSRTGLALAAQDLESSVKAGGQRRLDEYLFAADRMHKAQDPCMQRLTTQGCAGFGERSL